MGVGTWLESMTRVFALVIFALLDIVGVTNTFPGYLVAFYSDNLA